jgi:hypothetical protein
MLGRVALVRTDVTEELSASIIRMTRLRELGTTLALNSVVPSSPILVTMIKEALRSSETSILIRSTLLNIPEDTILYSHRREKLKSYKNFLFWKILETTALGRSNLKGVRHHKTQYYMKNLTRNSYWRSTFYLWVQIWASSFYRTVGPNVIGLSPRSNGTLPSVHASNESVKFHALNSRILNKLCSGMDAAPTQLLRRRDHVFVQTLAWGIYTYVIWRMENGNPGLST